MNNKIIDLLKKHNKTTTVLTVVVLLPLIWVLKTFNPISAGFYPPCFFYKFTGLYCPGCGTARSIHAFLNFHFLESAGYNILTFILILVFIYYFVVFIVNYITGRKILKWIDLKNVTLSRMVAVTFILFWVLRNIPVFPFNILAP